MAIDASLVFRALNVIVAVFMVAGGVATIIKVWSIGFPNFIQGIFCIIFGAVTGVFEFRLPRQITQYASFMFSFLGRGICKEQLDPMILCVVVVGVAYLVLHFIPGVQAPTNMQQSAFEESMGFSTRLADSHPMIPNHAAGGGALSGATPVMDPEAYPQKTYVSDGPTI
ncbi:COPI associated protein-domain-containing protein [Syncephalastrum racemosum]|uniref:COPI associated protein-domain-containing protein n=1 Tax=Syncephalastrum racemosum TaxID=13706 RepID=A0A1X2HP12_SYNRA|nr:COPI associated protein-domain-containing protein [Syncephalastrum racemosum]